MSTSLPSKGWIQTYTGQQFWPLAPTQDTVSIPDIAHALSLICRYGGHVPKFYSVAEHCVLLSMAVSPSNALWALLHDAAEAYVGDMVRPLKRSMPDFVAAEDRILQVIIEKFGLTWPMPAEVHDADNRILLNERQSVVTPTQLIWEGVDDQVPLTYFHGNYIRPQGWSPESAERAYLNRFFELTVSRPTTVLSAHTSHGHPARSEWPPIEGEE